MVRNYSPDTASSPINTLQHISLCHQCESAWNDCGCGCSKRSYLFIDDGSGPYDKLQKIPSVVNGYVQPTPPPASPDITLTLLAGETDEYALAPGPLSTMAAMELLFGFDAETDVGDLLMIAGFPAPNQSYNTIYYVTAVPTLSTPWYVIRRTDPFSGKCGLCVGSLIQVQLGTSAGDATWEITDIIAGPPKSMEVEITNYGADVDFYCLEVVKEPKC